MKNKGDFESLTVAMAEEVKQLNVKKVVITAGPAWDLRTGSQGVAANTRHSASSQSSYTSSRKLANAGFAICVDGELFGPFAKIAVGPCEATDVSAGSVLAGGMMAGDSDSTLGDSAAGEGEGRAPITIPVMSFLPPTSTSDESNAPLI